MNQIRYNRIGSKNYGLIIGGFQGEVIKWRKKKMYLVWGLGIRDQSKHLNHNVLIKHSLHFEYVLCKHTISYLAFLLVNWFSPGVSQALSLTRFNTHTHRSLHTFFFPLILSNTKSWIDYAGNTTEG